MRIAICLLLAALLGACSNHGDGGGGGGRGGKIGHVFIIVLENEDYDTSFGNDTPAPYLAHTLPAMGALLRQYYGTGHLSLDNYISMVSGQAPNPATQGDCLYYLDFVGAPVAGPDGQAIGQGCVYPAFVKSVGDLLREVGRSWRAYAEDMGNDVARDGGATCAHPPLNRQDPTQGAAANDNFAVRHMPFLYFHSVIDEQDYCDSHVVPLTALDADLAGATPEYVFITPSLCHDGHDAPCANGTEPGGLASINIFLETWVPKILASPAFQQDGLLIVTFDEASTSDSSACCNEQTGPNTPRPGITGAGGGRVGAVLLSPFIRPGTVSDVPYNHYSMLRSVEDIFGLPYLGYAGQAGLVPFGPDVYTNR